MGKRWSKLTVCLLLVALLSACGGSSSPTQPTSPDNNSAGRRYLDEILAIMQANSINRHQIDWASFRQSVYAAAGNAQTIQDVVKAAIPTALSLLGDHHSFYVSSAGVATYNPSPRGGCSDPAPPAVAPQPGIGYVKVTSFSGSGTAMLDFAVSIQDQIRAADGPAIRGWVVDLRRNGGGNMWPMIAGVGPVLGEGTAGAFVDPDGNVTRWGYANGTSFAESSVVVQVPSAYRVLAPNPRVAVLTDCGVASSGEATVVAFRGRPNTRSFGTPTYGLSTSNRTIILSDGASLYLTTATMADRNLARYGDVIVPDEVISDPAGTVQRAVEWLLQ